VSEPTRALSQGKALASRISRRHLPGHTRLGTPSSFSAAGFAKSQVGQFICELLAASRLGIAVFDHTLHCVALNSELASLLAGNETTLSETVTLHGPELRACIREVLMTSAPVVGVEVSLPVWAERRVFHSIANFLPIRNAGTVRHVVAIFIDASSNYRAQTQIPSFVNHETASVTQCEKHSQPGMIETNADFISSNPARTAPSRSRPRKQERARPEPAQRPLSEREEEVLRLILEEKGNKEIAYQLGLALSTVETHRKHLMLKLGVHSTVELVLLAARTGRVRIPSLPENHYSGSATVK